MFEIDLLKGKNRPYKTDLKRVVLGLVILLVPVAATMVYAAGLQHDRITLASLQRSAEANEIRMDDYAEDMRFLADLRRQMNDVSLSIADIGQTLRFRIVASSALVELAEGLPPDIFMREMNWRRTAQRERKVDPKTGQVRFDTYIQRSLRLALGGYEHTDSDAAVQTYIAHLQTAPSLKKLIREIRPAARQQGEIDGQNVTWYEIEVFLKDQR